MLDNCCELKASLGYNPPSELRDRSYVCELAAVITAPGRLKQENLRFRASLGYGARSCHKKREGKKEHLHSSNKR